MPLDKFKVLVDIAKKEEYKLIIPYYIGSPLLHPEYDQILIYVAEKKMNCKFHSRMGVKIDFDKYKKVFDAFQKIKNYLSIEMTIDGLPGDKIVDAVNMDYDLVWSNIERLSNLKQKMGYTHLRLKMATLVTSYNEDRLDQIGAMAKKFNIPWYPKSFGHVNAHESPEHIKLINELAPRDRKWWGRLREDENGNVRNRIKRGCSEGGKIPIISQEGAISICCLDSLQESAVGDVFKEGSIDKVLESKEYADALAKGKKKMYDTCKYKC